MKGTFMVPSAPTRDQMTAVWSMLAPLRKLGHTTGIMLNLFGGKRWDNIPAQYNLIAEVLADYGDAPVVVMPYCMPLEEMDILHYPQNFEKTIRNAIDYTAGLPVGTEKSVTFHLGSLVDTEFFHQNGARFWRNNLFPQIQERLRTLREYAETRNVTLFVETVPVPEFGDLSPDSNKTYRGYPLRNMLNPFYLTSHWGFDEVRAMGMGITLDTCHSRVIYDAARAGGPYNGVVFEEDISILGQRTLLDDVGALKSYDLVHLSNGRGLTSDTTQFEEGLPLDEGSISKNDMEEMIRTFMENGNAIILEINEKEYVERPNTKRSIKYIADLVGKA